MNKHFHALILTLIFVVMFNFITVVFFKRVIAHFIHTVLLGRAEGFWDWFVRLFCPKNPTTSVCIQCFLLHLCVLALLSGCSRGPSPLTMGAQDTLPVAAAFTETVNAFFKGADPSK